MIGRLIKTILDHCRNGWHVISAQAFAAIVVLWAALPPLLRRLPHPRMWGFALVALALLAWNADLQPEHLPELLYKLNNVVIAAVLAYWIDRESSPYGRPHLFLAVAGEGNPPGDLARAVFFAATTFRRAVIFLAVMVGLTQGI